MYREAEAAAVKASTVVNMGNSEESTVHSRVPAFLRESPYDTGVARGVKRAYTTLDAFSARLGLFLRRYPIARVMILVYMVRNQISAIRNQNYHVAKCIKQII